MESAETYAEKQSQRDEEHSCSMIYNNSGIHEAMLTTSLSSPLTSSTENPPLPMEDVNEKKSSSSSVSPCHHCSSMYQKDRRTKFVTQGSKPISKSSHSTTNKDNHRHSGCNGCTRWNCAYLICQAYHNNWNYVRASNELITECNPEPLFWIQGTWFWYDDQDTHWWWVATCSSLE